MKNATTCKRSYVKFARTTSGCAASAIAYATRFKICTASAASTAVLRTPQARLPLLDNATLARPVHDGPRNTDPPQLVVGHRLSRPTRPAHPEEDPRLRNERRHNIKNELGQLLDPIDPHSLRPPPRSPKANSLRTTRSPETGRSGPHQAMATPSTATRSRRRSRGRA